LVGILFFLKKELFFVIQGENIGSKKLISGFLLGFDKRIEG